MHESFDKKLEILNTEITFEEIYKKRYVPEEYLNDIKKANFLIIPNEKFRNEKLTFFPETTRQFFEYVKEHHDEGIIADIAISDNEFKQLELHSAIIEVATIIVKYAILPITTGIISAFLYDLTKKYHRNPNETIAKIKIIVEETDIKKSKTIIYEGPISEVNKALKQAMKNIFSKNQK